MSEIISSIFHIGWVILSALGYWFVISAVIFLVLLIAYSIRIQYENIERHKKIRKNTERRMRQTIAVAKRIAQEKAARERVNGDNDGKSAS